MNSDLKNDKYSLPEALLNLLKNKLSSLTKEDKGYDRCKKEHQ